MSLEEALGLLDGAWVPEVLGCTEEALEACMEALVRVFEANLNGQPTN
jgi:hypothetical protein